MNLQTYFDQYGTAGVKVMAERIGSSMAYLQHCKYGNRRMSADMAIRLEQASGGVLTARELRPDLPWPGVPAPTSTPLENAA